MKQYMTSGIVLAFFALLAYMGVRRSKEKIRIREIEAAKPPFEMHEPENAVLYGHDPPRKRHKHHVVINGSDQVLHYTFPHVLKNVESIELVSAIIPKTQTRIHSRNNILQLEINGTSHTIEIPVGDYENILFLLLEINFQIRPLLPSATSFLLFLLNIIEGKTIVTCTNDLTVTLKFKDVENSIGVPLGFGDDDYTITGDSLSRQDAEQFLSSSVTMLQDRIDNELNINNYPPSRYGSANLLPIDTDGIPQITMSGWNAIESLSRANLTYQLYIDVNIDEITYYDGSNRLARIFLPEGEDQVEYRTTGMNVGYTKDYPIYRKMRTKMSNLDRMTIRFEGVIDEKKKYPYLFYGLPYSLQFEIVTLDL